ncbi:hypothetical protein F4553_003179 [Allocatelliglobosispora scoriae]|uniref:Lipoprotein n=1 Tax=Allocatelliglobosispora scoriae TaxID=643052 RepID=A0A841BSN3_9ACTN|nr:hypothetical protein [Allocatelliglobosispora scoriae]MBB5869800.1 hypothetical protein [Allocatelliglobosispora scoriae]
MRRALVVVVLGGALLTAAACGTSTDNNATPSASATAAASAPVGRSAKDACDAIDPEKDPNHKAFTDEYGKMIAARVLGDKAATTAAQASAVTALRKLADGVRAVADDTADAEIKKSITEVSTKISASAADTAFFTGPKTIADMEKALTTAYLNWYTPIIAACS